MGDGAYRQFMPDEDMERVVKREYAPQIIEYTAEQLDRAFDYIRASGGMDFLNFGKIFDAVELSQPAPYHKPFDRSKALEHKALPNDENQKRMNDMRASLGI